MDPAYEAGKSYNSKDRKSFRSRTIHEGMRIQNLISALPYRTGAAIQFLMHKDRLAPEELLGIEHLVVKPKVAAKMAYERQEHSRFVLDNQRRLHERNPDGNHIDVALGDAAAASSEKHVESAKLRAVLAG
jgi:D-alanyl-D-alanine dipeptidase